MTLRMKDVHLVGVARAMPRSDAGESKSAENPAAIERGATKNSAAAERFRQKQKKGAGGPPLLLATADYFTTGTGTKQSMLVWMRKFDSNVCRSAWKISIGYEVPGTMPSAAAWASKSIEPVSAW